jgi:hypothetical protein
MTVEPIEYSSLDFVKNHNDVYFELLKLARNTEYDSKSDCSNDHITELSGIDQNKAITTLNQLSLFEKIHKRIIPLLNDKAHKLAIYDDLSAESKKVLTSATQQSVVTELARKKQLNNIVVILSEYNIPLILLKGAAFADVLYKPNAPRSSNDLDILIQQKYWHKAVEAIKTVMNYAEKLQPNVFGDLYELSFIPKGKMGAALDLHSSLIHPLLFNINEAQLWENSIEHPSYNNKLVRMLSPEHALIHQALHAYKDMDFSKYNLVDSHEIISVKKPDITKVILIAKEWGANIPLYSLLKNCIEVMDTDIKSNILKQIKPNTISYYFMVKLVKSRFAQPTDYKKKFRYRINQILGQFVFSGSVVKPLKLQWLFVKSKLITSKI